MKRSGTTGPAGQVVWQGCRESALMDDRTDTPIENDHGDNQPPAVSEHDGMDERLERLGGEPAPVITPEEFARLQKAGQVHIDNRGRVRTARPDRSDAGVSLRKRRAWYGR